MRNATSTQRLFWINCLGSLFSYNEGKRSHYATKIVIPDFDIDAEERENEYHYEFPNGDVIPCKDCQLEILRDEFGNEFHREFATEAFVFYVNREEGDENGACKMFIRETLELRADNYFASQALQEAIEGDKNDPIIWRSDYLNSILQEYYTEHLVTNIAYDCDELRDVKKLPKTFTVRINRTDYPTAVEVSDRISDIISEKTGFCHFGFTLSPEPQDKNEK